MESKINIRARIERHSRVLQHTLYEKGKHTGKMGLAIVSCISIFLFPFYPALATFAGGINEFNFSRMDIDETSIIDSFQLTEGTTLGENTVFIQSVDSYLQVNTSSINSNTSQVRASRDIIEHEVLGGENLGSIATKYNVSVNTIRWENKLTNDSLRPGQILRILPASGLSHKVSSGETLSGLAQRYKVTQEDIMRQNMLLSASELSTGETLIIPGAIIEPPKPVPAPQPQRNTTQNRAVANTSTPASTSAPAPATATANTQGRYQLVWRQPQWTFYWGNCTWYVAQYKNVNWSGNANQWLRNARAKGHATGNTPTLGAIVQLEGRGYNPRYGHVGIVIDFTDTHIIVSDMNYRRLGEVTTRQIPRNDTTISGYIYVD